MRVAFITPPPIKPSEPGLSAGAAAIALGGLGVPTLWIDASLEWHRYVLNPTRLSRLAETLTQDDGGDRHRNALRSAAARMGSRPAPLRRADTYASRATYSSAVADVENALRIVAEGHPAFRLGVAMIAPRDPALRLESSDTLAHLAQLPGPFDAYFIEELIPKLRAAAVTHVAVSLTFQQQAPAAFRLAALLEEQAPDLRRILGGPLVACWLAANIALMRDPFSRFHSVLCGSDEDLRHLASEAGGPAIPPESLPGPFSVPLEEAPWEDYLAPLPTVPAALGRGCYWRRCTFCPDSLHPGHQACSFDSLAAFLRGVAARFPDGAMLHLTDSALPPSHLEHVAEVIRRDRLPLRWHGFVRVEPAFADVEFVRHLADGGCAMLQFGVESGSPRLLQRMGKGASPELAGDVVRRTSAVGILNQVYLLFGLPTETDEDRELTMTWVASVAHAVDGINPSLLNLPKGSPMHRFPDRFGMTELVPFSMQTDLSLYEDFRCGDSHPRREARRWLGRRFFRHPAVTYIEGGLRGAFKANHLCFSSPRPHPAKDCNVTHR